MTQQTILIFKSSHLANESFCFHMKNAIFQYEPNYKNYELTEGRGKIHNIFRYKKRFKLIDESYNANPLSVKEAINGFSKIKTIG